MTSSTSSSSRAAALAAALALAGGPAAAAAEAPEGAPRRGLATRIAFFPLSNLSGASIPAKEIQAALESALRARGLSLVSGDGVDEFLARHRIRYTGGVETSTARAAREDLGVDAVLLAAASLHDAVGAPRFGLAMRLVSTSEPPKILWMDEDARVGDESPGLFGLGVVGSMAELKRRVISRLVGSLAAALEGKGPRFTTCDTGRRFRPRVLYRVPGVIQGRLPSVAVVPFVNQTRREDAGELLALDFVRELSRRGGVAVLEPGVVRAEFIRHRVIMEGGVSHETARIALATLEADVLVAGYVRTHEEQPVPRLEFTVLALETRENRVLWQSTSYARGDDWVVFYDWGRVSTTSGLACRMVRAAVEGMLAVLAPVGAGPLRSGEGRARPEG